MTTAVVSERAIHATRQIIFFYFFCKITLRLQNRETEKEGKKKGRRGVNEQKKSQRTSAADSRPVKLTAPRRRDKNQ